MFATLSTDEGPDTWFMRSVLKQMPEEKMRKVYVSAGPLVVDFPDGGPQNGIFRSLMSYIISPENRHPYSWKLCLSSNVPSCLYRDCIQFEVPKYPGSVTLFDYYEFFEVHVFTSDEEKLGNTLKMHYLKELKKCVKLYTISQNQPSCPQDLTQISPTQHSLWIQSGIALVTLVCLAT